MSTVVSDVEMAERAVLGACLLGGTKIVDEVGDVLTAGDFASSRHAQAFVALQRIVDAGQSVDEMTLAQHMITLQGSGAEVAERKAGDVDALGPVLDWVMEMSAGTMAVNGVMHWARGVKGSSKIRRFGAQVQRIAREVQGLDIRIAQKAGDYIDQAIDTLISYGDERNSIIDTTASQVAKSIVEQVRRRSSGDHTPSGPSTGFNELDNLIGPLDPQTLLLLGAASGMGKTALAVAMASNVCREGSVTLYVTLEVQADQVVRRQLACESRIDSRAISRRTGLMDDETIKFIQAVNGSAGWMKRFHILDAPSATVPLVARRVRRLQRMGQSPDLVVIDYGQLLRSTRKHANREQAVAEVADDVLEMTKEYKIATTVALQLNREYVKRPDKRPRMSDMRESSRFEHHSHVGMLLHRPGVEDPEQPKNLAEVLISKNRNGETGMVRLDFNPAQNRFADWSGPR